MRKIVLLITGLIIGDLYGIAGQVPIDPPLAVTEHDLPDSTPAFQYAVNAISTTTATTAANICFSNPVPTSATTTMVYK